MRYLIISLIFICACAANLQASVADPQNRPGAKDSVSATIDTSKVENKKVLMVANISRGKKVEEISDFKVEAALNAIAAMTGKYTLISLTLRDTVVNYLKSINKTPSVLELANELYPDKLLFININRFENMLRVEITSIDAKEPERKSEGIGYAELHFVKAGNIPLYDPILLMAMQRAFAAAEGDSLMFAAMPGKFCVFPAKPLVIGGIDFQLDDRLFKWKIFDYRVINSYEAAETIYEAAVGSSDYVIYDIPTRDSIYSYFNCHIVENYRPPSPYELEILGKFDVEMYISGIFKRVVKGAELELILSRIVDKKLLVVSTEKGFLDEDDTSKFRALLKELTLKLLGINDEKSSKE